MQKNGKLYHYPLVLDTKKGGRSLLFIYIKYNALCLILLVHYCPIRYHAEAP